MVSPALWNAEDMGNITVSFQGQEVGALAGIKQINGKENENLRLSDAYKARLKMWRYG